MEQENRQVKSEDVAKRMIAEYESRLATGTEELEDCSATWPSFMTQQKNFDKALEAYQRIIAQEGNTDASLQKVIAETKIKKLNHAIAQLDPAGARRRAEKIKQLEGERDAFFLADCEQRAEKYPNDLVIRFELGKLYFQTGKNQRGHQGISEGAKQSEQAHPIAQLPGPMLCRRGA